MPSPAPAPKSPTTARNLAHGLGLAMVAITLAWYVPANQHLQWDLRAYALAARAAWAGLDPYRVESLAAVAGRAWGLPFLYPPVTLPLFLPMAALPFPVVAALWMTLKLGALATLAWIWQRRVGTGAGTLALVVTLLFGFGGATLLDLRAGNIAVFEALLVWTGLALWMRGRHVAFTLCIVLASLFKLAPIAFLTLLLVPAEGGGRHRRLFAAGSIAFVLAIALPELVGPAAGWHALAAAWTAPPASVDDPGAVALLDGLFAGPPQGLLGPARLAWLGYLAAVAALGWTWLRHGARTRARREWALAAAMLWMLLSPRPMGYGYVMAIAPALALAPRPFRGSAGSLALAAALSVQAWLRLADLPPLGLWQRQLPFLMLLGLWLLRVREDLATPEPLERTRDAGFVPAADPSAAWAAETATSGTRRSASARSAR